MLPGAGGTQRLPRVVGTQKALEMMLSGNPVKAEEAEQIGLIDELVDGDLLTGAVQAYIFAILAMVFIAAAVSDGKPAATIPNTGTTL